MHTDTGFTFISNEDDRELLFQHRTSIQLSAGRSLRFGYRARMLAAIKCIQPRSDAGASDERGPIEHGEAGRSRARLGVVQGARGEQVVVRRVDRGHGRVVLRGESADVRRVFDAAVDGEADGAVEFVVQHFIAV